MAFYLLHDYFSQFFELVYIVFVALRLENILNLLWQLQSLTQALPVCVDGAIEDVKLTLSIGRLSSLSFHR